MPIIIKNGKVYGDRSVTLSQAEYNALSEVEKNNGTTYYIYDVNGVVTADDVALDGGTVETLAGSVATFESSPATATHAVGDYILWNGQLYTVTAAIAVGETLTVGTNITSTNVGSELTALNAGLIEYEDFAGTVGGVTQTFHRMKIGNIYAIFGTGKVNASVGGNTVAERPIVFSEKEFTTVLGGACNLAMRGSTNSQTRYTEFQTHRIDSYVYNGSNSAITEVFYSFIVFGT